MTRPEFLNKLALDAGALLCKWGAAGAGITDKAENDFVTEDDRRTEAFIRGRINEAWPEDGVLGEEYGEAEGHDGYLWIVDPIDGTVNYMNGFPAFTVSIGLSKGGELVAGAVYCVSRDELFTAEKGKGAFLNGKPIRAMEGLPLSKTLALVVPPHRFHPHLDEFWEREKQIYSLVSDTRSIGSAALSLCYVASGRCSLYYEWFLHIYDIAAGLVIASEAGCAFKMEEEEGGMYRLLAVSKAYEKEALEVPLC